MAFHFACRKIKFSVSYDGFTFYPLAVGGGLVKEGRMLTTAEPAKPSKDILDAVATGIKEISGIQREIFHHSADHKLYHPEHDSTENHTHYKFHSQLKRDTLAEILLVFVKQQLLSVAEKTALLSAWDKRFADPVEHLEHKLQYANSNKKEAAVNDILKVIENCKENDVLVALHAHLLKDKYHYLRDMTGPIPLSFWRGTIDDNGTIAMTSASWASIEKAFALQMAVNIIGRSPLTQTYAAQIAAQLRKSHGFFAIKRHDIDLLQMLEKMGSEEKSNATYEAFSQGNMEAVKAKHQRHFKR